MPKALIRKWGPTPAVALQIADASARNARQYLEDAGLLAERESFAHATALALLGQEELAKAFFHWMLAHGAFPEGTKAHKGMFSNHLIKQCLGVVFFELPQLFAPEWVEEMSQKLILTEEELKSLDEPGIGSLLHKWAQLVDSELIVNPSVAQKFRLECEKAMRGETQRLKENAMYVEWRNDSVAAPQAMTRVDYITQFEVLERGLSCWDQWCTDPIEEEELELLRQFLPGVTTWLLEAAEEAEDGRDSAP